MTRGRVEEVETMHGPARLRSLVAIVAVVAAVTIPMSPAAAVPAPDQVLAWNQVAYDELIVGKAQAPPVAVLHFAMVHGAIYDAVNAIDGGFAPYLGSPAADGSESQNAAAAAAAYGVLASLLPDRAGALATQYQASITALEAVEDPTDVAAGEAIGAAAAAAMIAARTGDGRIGGSQFFTEGTDAGEWRNAVGPLNPAGNNFKWVGDVTPFLIEDAADFATSGPQPLTSGKYATEFDQVKALGSATGSTRTADQTEMAHFWVDHALAMWTRIFRQLSANQDLTPTENARFFAMLYLTGADAAIACFQDKERWHFWRPQTAIRLAATDGNDATVADPTWTPLIANPPYPDQPSGHNCLSSSIVETLKDFFGTNVMSFSATRASSPIGPITRSFTRFSQAIGEIRLARVYAGIHFMTADATGASLGRKVAAFRDANYFQRLA
jgi:hypothetical protein